MWLLRSISLPHLTRHALRTALTLFGVALGVAAVVATTAVSDSVFRSFERGVHATAGRAQLHLSNGSIGVPEDLVEEVRATGGVQSAAPFLEGYVFLSGHPGETLAIFGADLLADVVHEVQLPRSAVHVPDDIGFVNHVDSIAVSRSFAQTHGLDIGSTLQVLGASGQQTLTVRGLVDAVGPAGLFGGAVGFMDVPAAQTLLGKDRNVDRIDVVTEPDADLGKIADALRAVARSRATVDETSVHGAKARDLLFSLRVALTLAGLIAALVGFFIIHQTVRISILQRRREIALLGALGVSNRSIVSWLIVEAGMIGATAAAVGLVLGVLVAKASVGTFGSVTDMWVRSSSQDLEISLTTIALAVAVGIGMTLAATLATIWSISRAPGARYLHLVPRFEAGRTAIVWARLGAAAALLLTALLVAVAPPTMPYLPLVAYLAALQCLILLAFTLLSPSVALMVGRAASAAANTASGHISLLVSSRWIARAPAAPVAVAAAMVAGLGATLADASLIASFKHSWLTWVDQHYQSDLIVSGGSATVTLLTSPTFSDDIVGEVAALPGVARVQGVRLVEARFRECPVVIQAWDRIPTGLPMGDDSWEPIADRFWNGEGVLVTDNLALKAELGAGSVVTLDTPSGQQQFPILGVFPDYQGGDLGGFAVSRPLYKRIWRDALVNRVRVWVAPTATVAGVRQQVDGTLGPSRGLRAVSAGEFRAAVADVVDRAFALSYALVVIALTVSFVGVVNLLLAAVLDRQAALRTLSAVGVSSRQIALAIVLEGGLIGVIGTVVGLAAGFLASWVIVTYSVPMVNGWRFTHQFPAATALVLSVGTILFAGLAGVIPAQLALRSAATDGRAE